MPSALLLASYAAFAGAAYLITLGIYRIFFSSISHIPGPKLAALTYYYQSWYDVYPHQGRFLWKCKELHGRHGPIVRIGPNEVHVHCPEIYVDMYGSHKNRRNKAASWFWMIGTGEFGDGSVFATLPDDLHRRRRSALSPYFSKQMVQKLEPRVHEKVLLLKDRILELAREGPVELTNAMSGLTLDIITKYATGHSAEFLRQPDLGRSVNEMIRDGAALHPFGRTFPTLAFLLLKFANAIAWKGSAPAQMKGFVTLFDNLTLQSLQEDAGPKGESSENAPTVAQAMQRSTTLPPEEKTLWRICADSQILVAAGAETTARTLAVTFYHILANPAVHTQVLQELRTVIPTPSAPLPKVATLEALPYFTAVVSEGLRISHGVAGRMARMAPEQDLRVGEYVIPRGTTFSQSTYLIHTDPNIFPEPFKFVPERFLGDEAATAYKNLHTFGKGPRSCLGMNLAYSEIYLTIACLLTGTKMELIDTTIEDVTIVREYLVGGLPAHSKGIRVAVHEV